MKSNKTFIGDYFPRLVILLYIPLIVFLYIGSVLSSGSCFTPDTSSASVTTSELSKKIDVNYTHIQNLNPLLEFNSNWFSYDVLLKNNFKIAIVTDNPRSFTVATTTTFIKTSTGTSSIPFGELAIIAKGVRGNQISELINAYEFSAESANFVVGPNNKIEIQTNPSFGNICIAVILERNILLYVGCLVIFIGILLLLKEAISFVIRGNKYFTS